MELVREDFGTRAWRALDAHLQSRLKDLRRQIEITSTTHDQTQVLRGKIALCKEILALPEQGSAGHEAAPDQFGDGAGARWPDDERLT